MKKITFFISIFLLIQSSYSKEVCILSVTGSYETRIVLNCDDEQKVYEDVYELNELLFTKKLKELEENGFQTIECQLERERNSCLLIRD
jgi:phosphatidylserine decarboxylase